MRRSTVFTLGASVGFGVLAIFLARGFINSALQSNSQNKQTALVSLPADKPVTKTVPVMVADTALVPGDILSRQSVRFANFPEDAIPQGSYSRFEAAFSDLDKPVVVLARMAQGEPVLDFKLSTPGGRATLSAGLAPGMRAVSIRVNDVSGVAGFIQPDDRVDINLTRELDAVREGKSASAKPVFITDMLMQDIKVLGIDQKTYTESGQPKLVRTVTLEVNPQQSSKLALGQAVGTLTLALRGNSENGEVKLSSIRMSDLKNARTVARSKKARRVRKTRSANVTVVRDDGQAELVKVFREQPKMRELAGGIK